MKKIIGVSLTLLMSAVMFTASAMGHIPGTIKRNNIKVPNKVVDNPVIPGESPTTGLPTDNTAYVPILVQIDNNLSGIPQWGISQADMIYEMILTGTGHTRLTALFSDNYPSEAGPVRSGRVMHADLREAWDALIVFFGAQEDAGSDLREALSNYRVNSKGLAADGHANKFNVPGDEYFTRVRYHKAPHNVTAYILKFRDMMISSGYEFVPHPFLFTDNTSYSGVPASEITVVHRGNEDTSSSFVYDAQSNSYQRYTQLGAYIDYLNPVATLSFSNVIIQRSTLTWNNSSNAPLFNEVVGSGAADMFIAGQYIEGAWARSSMQGRTAFYDQNGNEIQLQRGKTWVIVTDDKTDVVVGGSGVDLSHLFVPTGDENEEVVTDEGKETETTSSTVVAESTASDDAPIGNSATVTVPGNGPLNMRKSDSGKADIMLRIPHGSIVSIVEEGDEWSKVSFDGKIGYVMSKYLK